MRRQRKSLLWLLLYSLLMLWLLFGQRLENREEVGKINLVPFATVRLYWRVLQRQSSPKLVLHSVVNLVGNVALFVPLGWLLPEIGRPFRGVFRTVFFAVSLICLVEILQYLTGLGSCDIDDLILNTVGVLTGYCFWKQKKKNSP